jgi:ribosomal 50S subunit-recycling heat shock protein
MKTAPMNNSMEDIMRLDKYLKVSRIIKRRTIANQACDAGRVMVNGKTSKAGYELKTGYIISIGFGGKNTQYEVLSLDEHVLKNDAQGMYRII